MILLNSLLLSWIWLDFSHFLSTFLSFPLHSSLPFTPLFIRFSNYKIDGALLVYDITDAESFVKVKKWVKELRKIVGNDIIIAIAGNKVDLEKNRHVDEREAAEYVLLWYWIFISLTRLILISLDMQPLLVHNIFIHLQNQIKV